MSVVSYVVKLSVSGMRLSGNFTTMDCTSVYKEETLYHMICVVAQYGIKSLICRTSCRVNSLEFHCPLRGGFRAVLIKGDRHRPGPLQLLSGKSQFIHQTHRLSVISLKYSIAQVWRKGKPLFAGTIGKKLLRCNQRKISKAAGRIVGSIEK